MFCPFFFQVLLTTWGRRGAVASRQRRSEGACERSRRRQEQNTELESGDMGTSLGSVIKQFCVFGQGTALSQVSIVSPAKWVWKLDLKDPWLLWGARSVLSAWQNSRLQTLTKNLKLFYAIFGKSLKTLGIKGQWAHISASSHPKGPEMAESVCLGTSEWMRVWVCMCVHETVFKTG